MLENIGIDQGKKKQSILRTKRSMDKKIMDRPKIDYQNDFRGYGNRLVIKKTRYLKTNSMPTSPKRMINPGKLDPMKNHLPDVETEDVE